MPNWVEGKLKIRGKPEDIKRWVEECLHCYTTNWLGDGAHTELVKGAVRFERDPDSEEMYLYVDKGFIRFYQRKLGNGRTYFVVKNGMRVRAAVTSYSLNEYAEATLQELVAMLAETHTGEQEEHEQTFDNLTDEAEDKADDEKA